MSCARTRELYIDKDLVYCIKEQPHEKKILKRSKSKLVINDYKSIKRI